MTRRAADFPRPASVALRTWVLLGLGVLLAAGAALAVGRYALSPAKLPWMLLEPVWPSSWTQGWPAISDVERRVLWHVRMPRVLMALLTGSSLALCGAALQGAFRNPLVGPQVLGISSGAAFGGCLAILCAGALPWIMGGAFAGGLLAILLVYSLAHQRGRTSRLTLVLAGIVCSAFFSALVSLVTYVADASDTLPAIVFWLLGSFATASYFKLGMVCAPVALGMGLLLALRFRINVLSLGDELARAQGVAVEPLRWALLACVTLVVSASVAVSGTVGWVGLVVPHFARMLVGHDHRVLLPASALIGAMYMAAVDTLARSLTSAEVPLGVMTALIGAPVFAWLLKRSQLGKEAM